MDASTKMVLVDLHTLFIVQDALFELLQVFICLAKIEKCAGFREIRRILALDLN
jgi:hypothetical protein